jgi:hypothetical protein
MERCSICRHPDREAIEDALGRRMRQQQGEATWVADAKTAEFLRLVTKMLERHPETLQEFTEELKKLEGEEAA